MGMLSGRRPLRCGRSQVAAMEPGNAASMTRYTGVASAVPTSPVTTAVIDRSGLMASTIARLTTLPIDVATNECTPQPNTSADGMTAIANTGSSRRGLPGLTNARDGAQRI